MTRSLLEALFARLRKLAGRKALSPKARRHRLTLEILEDRCLLATITWMGKVAGAEGTNWFNPLNWDLKRLPTAQDDVDLKAAPNDPTIEPDGVHLSAEAKSLQVSPGVNLEIKGISLDVTNNVDDGGTIVIQGAAAHLNCWNYGTVTNSDNLTFEDGGTVFGSVINKGRLYVKSSGIITNDLTNYRLIEFSQGIKPAPETLQVGGDFEEIGQLAVIHVQVSGDGIDVVQVNGAAILSGSFTVRNRAKITYRVTRSLADGFHNSIRHDICAA